ncbi:MAG: PEP-CTERM sorting domain-containing protein [Colwellia sp.]
MKKALTAAVVALSFAGAAVADPIMVDLNPVHDVSGNLITSTPTQTLTSLNVDYSSHTMVNLTTGVVNTYAGMDTIDNSFGGLLSGDIYTDFNDMTTEGNAYTNVLSAIPDATLAEYFASGSFLTFGLNLTGMLTPQGITYTGGELSLWSGDYSTDIFGFATTNPVELLTATFQSGGITAGDQSILALVNDSVQVHQNDTFFFDTWSGPISFEDYLAENVLAEIHVNVNQNVTGGAFNLFDDISNPIEGGTNQDDQSWVYISAPHNAELSFNVPEPTSIAILGLGLLGFAGARRRKS